MLHWISGPKIQFTTNGVNTNKFTDVLLLFISIYCFFPFFSVTRSSHCGRKSWEIWNDKDRKNGHRWTELRSSYNKTKPLCLWQAQVCVCYVTLLASPAAPFPLWPVSRHNDHFTGFFLMWGTVLSLTRLTTYNKALGNHSWCGCGFGIQHSQTHRHLDDLSL